MYYCFIRCAKTVHLLLCVAQLLQCSSTACCMSCTRTYCSLKSLIYNTGWFMSCTRTYCSLKSLIYSMILPMQNCVWSLIVYFLKIFFVFSFINLWLSRQLNGFSALDQSVSSINQIEICSAPTTVRTQVHYGWLCKGEKIKFWVLAISLLTWVYSRPVAPHNLGIGSSLAWADDTAVHYAAIHCPVSDSWTRGAAQQIYHRPNQPH